MLDYLPTPVRHALIALAGSLLGWATEALPGFNLPAPVAMIAGTVLAVAGMYLTPLTRQYGVGAAPMAEHDDTDWLED